MKSKTVTIKVSEEMYYKIKARADDLEITIEQFAREFLEFSLLDKEKGKEFESLFEL